jgi:hypothetical protein
MLRPETLNAKNRKRLAQQTSNLNSKPKTSNSKLKLPNGMVL